MSTHPGDGKVAIYRWFENGEGWAFHPWFGTRGLELSRALDAILKHGAGGAFCVPALGGYLVGEQSEDPSCPDAKARLRRPIILRAAFFGRRPIDAEKAVLPALHALPLPTHRREDDALALDAALCGTLAFAADEQSRLVPPADAPSTLSAGSSIPRRRLILALSIAALVVLGLGGAFATRHYQRWQMKDEEPPPEPIRTPQPVPPLPVIQDPGIRLDLLTAGRFRQALGAYAAVDHPYPAYLKAQSERLPQSAAVYQDRRQLRQLLPDLLRESTLDVEAASDEALAAALAGEIHYESWREGAGKREYRDRDKPLPEELRRFVERFRRPPSPLRKTAGAMAELLQTWGEREPSVRYAGEQPFIAIDRFFVFLTRPRFAPRPLTLDHPKVAFLWRLPADTVGEGQTYDTEADLARPLRELLYRLDPRFNPREETEPVASLLRRISDAMRYDNWRRGDGSRTYVDEEKTVGSEVDAFIVRFAR